MLSYIKNRAYHELSFILASIGIAGQRFKITKKFEVAVPVREVRRIFKKNDLYFNKFGKPSWWFDSYMKKRNTCDDLTNAVLEYINTNITKNANFLITGCGTGWMMFWLAQQGFSRLNGFDYLQNVISAANDLAKSMNIKAKMWQDDGFSPRAPLEQYDVIMALHWLYSAWHGNYGNKSYDPKESPELLKQFMSIYVPHLSKGGIFIVELIDSIADFKVPSSDIYPVRHSSEQVAQGANTLGLSVEKKMFCGKYGHQPRMIYILRKR